MGDEHFIIAATPQQTHTSELHTDAH